MFIKSPDSKLDYILDWAAWLSSGETIIDSSWEINSSELVNEGSFILNQSKSVSLWVSGGVFNKTYTIKNIITTSLGKIESHIFQIKIGLK